MKETGLEAKMTEREQLLAQKQELEEAKAEADEAVKKHLRAYDTCKPDDGPLMHRKLKAVNAARLLVHMHANRAISAIELQLNKETELDL